MPPRLDEAFLRAIRAQIAEMPAQRFYLNGEPFGEIANLWQTPAPEPEAEPEIIVSLKETVLIVGFGEHIRRQSLLG